MKQRRVIEAAIIAVYALLSLSSASAAVVVVAGQEGTNDPPQPTEGASTEEDWNPVVTCTVPVGGSIDDLLNCLIDRVATPPPACPTLETVNPPADGGRLQKKINPPNCTEPADRHDFIVTRLSPPEYGVEIRRLDWSEIERVALRENDPGIQTTELRNEKPDRVARVRLMEQTPLGGAVYLTINDVTVTILTGNVSIVENNARLIRQLRDAGMTLTYVSPYLYVRDRRNTVWGVNRIQFRSTDPGIIQSDLGLYPEGDPAVPPPGPISIP